MCELSPTLINTFPHYAHVIIFISQTHSYPAGLLQYISSAVPHHNQCVFKS